MHQASIPVRHNAWTELKKYSIICIRNDVVKSEVVECKEKNISMQKKEFKYRQMKYVVVWMLVLGAPFILFVPDLLSQIDGTAYYIVNTLTMIFIIFVLWRLVNILPGVQRTGYFWKENGITVIEYGSKRVILNSVTELMLTDRHASSQGINLLIRNDGRRIEFLSEPLDKGSSIDSTSLYNIFSQVLAENSRLKMENDSDGEPIDYWYKVG